MGPTASGKTDLAINLSKTYPFDIISCDSAMVYKGMDIGTAKPSKAELSQAPHRLIDLCDPAQNYSAGQFCQDAMREINSIFANNRIPLLVGGTMLYFNLLQKGFSEFPAADLIIRDEINLEAETVGWAVMHKRLAKIDPEAAKVIHYNDTQRISRALELYRSSGQTMTELQSQQQWNDLPFEIINIILTPSDRSIVHQRIEQRFDKMLEQGLIDEVNALFQRDDLNQSTASMRMVNYRQVWCYLNNEYDKNEMRDRAIFATRQFAKRQYTWLRRWPRAKIFYSDKADVNDDVCSYLRNK